MSFSLMSLNGRKALAFNIIIFYICNECNCYYFLLTNIILFIIITGDTIINHVCTSVKEKTRAIAGQHCISSSLLTVFICFRII